jgi:hypothetical protein
MKLSMNMIGKKRITFKNLKIDDTIDLSSSGYALNYFLYLITIHYFVSKKINIQNVLFVEKNMRKL